MRLYLVTLIGTRWNDFNRAIQGFATFVECAGEDEALGMAIKHFNQNHPGFSVEAPTVSDVSARAREWAARNP